MFKKSTGTTASPVHGTGVVLNALSGDRIVLYNRKATNPEAPENNIVVTLAFVKVDKFDRKADAVSGLAWAARSRVIELLLGKTVRFQMIDQRGEVKLFSVQYKEGKKVFDLSERLISEGLAGLRLISDYKDNEYYLKLKDALQLATENAVGMHSPESDKMFPKKCLLHNPPIADILYHKTEGKKRKIINYLPRKIVVEDVLCPTAIKVRLCDTNQMTVVELIGIRPPPMTLEGSKDNPVYRQAQFFTQLRLLCREFLFEFVGQTEFGRLCGRLSAPDHKCPDFSLLLLKKGFCKLNEATLRLCASIPLKPVLTLAEYRKTEEKAREEQVGVWKDVIKISDDIHYCHGHVVRTPSCDRVHVIDDETKEERVLFFAGINTPKRGKDWFYEAFSFVRQMCIGAHIKYKAEYVSEGGKNEPPMSNSLSLAAVTSSSSSDVRVMCRVLVPAAEISKNLRIGKKKGSKDPFYSVAEELVRAGLAKAWRHSDRDLVRSSEASKIADAEDQASSAKLCIHSKETAPLHHLEDISSSKVHITELLPHMKGKELEATIESVLGGHIFLISIPEFSIKCRFQCQFIRTPSKYDKLIDKQTLSETVKTRTRRRLMQRDVVIKVSSSNSGGVLLGLLKMRYENDSLAKQVSSSIKLTKGSLVDYALLLLKEGWATTDERLSSTPSLYKEAENNAIAHRYGMFRNKVIINSVITHRSVPLLPSSESTFRLFSVCGVSTTDPLLLMGYFKQDDNGFDVDIHVPPSHIIPSQGSYPDMVAVKEGDGKVARGKVLSKDATGSRVLFIDTGVCKRVTSDDILGYLSDSFASKPSIGCRVRLCLLKTNKKLHAEVHDDMREFVIGNDIYVSVVAEEPRTDAEILHGVVFPYFDMTASKIPKIEDSLNYFFIDKGLCMVNPEHGKQKIFSKIIEPFVECQKKAHERGDLDYLLMLEGEMEESSDSI
ncbi:hypothetical protein ADUPG1_006912 [Aduncisulcus paluster]|uniref:TNase-like domain-containing protein n=1 Tax=Aduncisulcus paluster TaxID=2918883 RepID=A0ABQ5KPM0_9EUKA|nr:hypothetical protein ADUPG1_006912 [Aduncisulcus paluster]